MSITIDVSVSFLKYELESTIDQAVRCAVETVLKETVRVVGSKLSAAQTAAAKSHRENQSLKERLEISESELKAVRYYVAAAEKNIKQCLQLNNTPPNVRSASTSEESLLPCPQSSTINLLTKGITQAQKPFRASQTKSQFSKPVTSVGLCLPTVQREWPRSSSSLRRMRASSTAVSSLHISQTSKAPQLADGNISQDVEYTDVPFFITDDGTEVKEYKVPDGGGNGMEHDSTMKALVVCAETADISSFEFEMGPPANSEPDCGLIQNLDEVEEVKGTIKIEQDPDAAVQEHPPPEPQQPSERTPPMADQDNDSYMLGFVPITEGDTGPIQVQRDSSDKIHRCNICGRGFRRFYCLKTHQRIHTGERPYPCRYCEKRFRHLDSLHKHQRIHTGERPYRCAQCGCCFRELGQLKKHRQTHSPVPNTAHPTPSLVQAGPSYTWPHLNSQSLDST
ncbi:uncharacterized protein FYW47_005510 [Aplochiton taeniatus]